jgi:hypothetical protein
MPRPPERTCRDPIRLVTPGRDPSPGGRSSYHDHPVGAPMRTGCVGNGSKSVDVMKVAAVGLGSVSAVTAARRAWRGRKV